MIRKRPFTVSPSPNTLYHTDTMKDIRNKVEYVIEDRQGLTAILGDAGHGKSSLLRYILNFYAEAEGYTTAFISTPTFKSDFAFVKAVADEFDLPARKSLYDQLRDFQTFLAAEYVAGRNVLLFIDEAHRLDNSMLEQLRGFLNFETDHDKMIQIILAAQLELGERLKKKTQKAIRSRVIAPGLMPTLAPGEIKSLLTHRCELAQVPVPFTADCYERIWQVTGGIPREALKLAAICYNVMVRADESMIDLETLSEAAAEFRIVGEEVEDVDLQETAGDEAAR